MPKLEMTKEERRQYLKDWNQPWYMKWECEECGHNAAVATDVTMEMDHGENKQKYYRMVHFFCLDCKERFSNWESNFD